MQGGCVQTLETTAVIRGFRIPDNAGQLPIAKMRGLPRMPRSRPRAGPAQIQPRMPQCSTSTGPEPAVVRAAERAPRPWHLASACAGNWAF